MAVSLTAGSLRRLLPGPAGLLWTAAAVLLGAAVVDALWDPDLGWHLATGRWIWETGQAPRSDPFAPAAEARPWLAHEWLFEAFLHGVYRAGGEPALVLLPALAAAGTAAFALRRAQVRGVAAALGAPLVLVALFPTHEFWSQRPQLFTFLLLSFVLLDLQRYVDGQRGLPWRLVGIVALWANLHGAFVVAALAIVAHLAGAGVEWLRGDGAARTRAKELGLLLGAVLAAGLVNPRGWGLYAHAWMYASSDWMGIAIVDWQSPSFADPRRLLFAAVILAALVAAALAGGKARPGDLFLVAGFTLMALRWQRNVPLALIAAAPLVAVWLRAAAEGAFPRLAAGGSGEKSSLSPFSVGRGLLHLAILALLAVGFTAARWPCDGDRCERPGSFPTALAARLREQGPPPGRGFNHFDWGGYLLWRNPGQRVYIDGRAPELDLPRLQTYARIHRLEPGWRGLLDREGVAWVLYPDDSPLARALRADGWSPAIADETGALLVRPGVQRNPPESLERSDPGSSSR